MNNNQKIAKYYMHLLLYNVGCGFSARRYDKLIPETFRYLFLNIYKYNYVQKNFHLQKNKNENWDYIIVSIYMICILMT